MTIKHPRRRRPGTRKMTPELLLPAAFAAGFFGSTHCLVMCGPIVLLFEGGRQHVKSGFLRRIAYNLGRMLFYVVLGTLAGASGALMTSELGGLSVLRVVAAALIILLGLNLVFDWRSLQFLESAGLRAPDYLPRACSRSRLPVGCPALRPRLQCGRAGGHERWRYCRHRNDDGILVRHASRVAACGTICRRSQQMDQKSEDSRRGGPVTHYCRSDIRWPAHPERRGTRDAVRWIGGRASRGAIYEPVRMNLQASPSTHPCPPSPPADTQQRAA
jgi:hypothetical protein